MPKADRPNDYKKLFVSDLALCLICVLEERGVDFTFTNHRLLFLANFLTADFLSLYRQRPKVHRLRMRRQRPEVSFIIYICYPRGERAQRNITSKLNHTRWRLFLKNVGKPRSGVPPWCLTCSPFILNKLDTWNSTCILAYSLEYLAWKWWLY